MHNSSCASYFTDVLLFDGKIPLSGLVVAERNVLSPITDITPKAFPTPARGASLLPGGDRSYRFSRNRFQLEPQPRGDALLSNTKLVLEVAHKST